jgi:lipoprotein-anchoring transpeptidase ErfK/SrfK
VGRHGISRSTGTLAAFGGKSQSLSGTALSSSCWRIALLTAAAAICIDSQAEAAVYWSDSDPGFSRPGPEAPRRAQRARRRSAKKVETPGKEASKPQGPLVIAISINNQNLRIYDANGLFAETPISTGMRGHPTPLGVFSVIQKQKLHHSNIYSGAPMPYMQRITWSGIAIHAGVLPGYPASHGCIRMPMAFAVKMWGWTKMGARVVVTPGEMTPASFSHPLLVENKTAPQPIAANEPSADAATAAKTDKVADANATVKPATSELSLELRSSVGHDGGIKSEPAATVPLREQTHTANAGALPATKAAVSMSDAASASSDAAPSASRGDDQASNTDAKIEEPATADRAEIASSDGKSVEAKSPEAAAAVNASADENIRSDAANVEAKAEVKTATPTASTAAPNEKPDDSVKAVTDASASIADAKKELTRSPDTEKTIAPKADPATIAAPKSSGQISVFVSRKDSKLYVRQNFAPLFDVPVTIAPSDRLLGTHVFTAQADKDDANVLHWSVVSLPVPARSAQRRDEDERASYRRKIAGAAEIKPVLAPDSPAEALDRLTIPTEAMARITEALSTGASMIVSDQGIAAGETGEGTDFILSLR